MNYESPESYVDFFWDDPLLQSQGGSITTPEDTIEP